MQPDYFVRVYENNFSLINHYKFIVVFRKETKEKIKIPSMTALAPFELVAATHSNKIGRLKLKVSYLNLLPIP